MIMMLTRFRGLQSLLCGVFVLLLCAESASGEVVLPAVEESGSVIVTTETADVREGPAAGYDVITVVAKGEIFDKQGRTGAWYYIRINDDSFGWICGRAISRYQTGETQPTYVEPRDEQTDRGDYPYYPYYPDYSYYPMYPYGYYDYPFYYWGQPYYSSGYYYGNNYYRGRSWDHDGVHPQNRSYPRYQGNGGRGGGSSYGNYNNGGRYRVPRAPSLAPRAPGLTPRSPGTSRPPSGSRGGSGFRRR